MRYSNETVEGFILMELYVRGSMQEEDVCSRHGIPSGLVKKCLEGLKGQELVTKSYAETTYPARAASYSLNYDRPIQVANRLGIEMPADGFR